MEPEGSLSYSQVPATCPYPEPTPSSLHLVVSNGINSYQDYIAWMVNE